MYSGGLDVKAGKASGIAGRAEQLLGAGVSLRLAPGGAESAG